MLYFGRGNVCASVNLNLKIRNAEIPEFNDKVVFLESLLMSITEPLKLLICMINQTTNSPIQNSDKLVLHISKLNYCSCQCLLLNVSACQIDNNHQQNKKAFHNRKMSTLSADSHYLKFSVIQTVTILLDSLKRIPIPGNSSTSSPIT